MALSLVVFPLVLALVCTGWGLLGREFLRVPLDGPLLVPFGFAAVVVATGLLTAWPVLAPLTVSVIALVAAAGLVRHLWVRRLRVTLDWWAVLVGASLLVALGAPVIASGHATFAGYLRLDDTSTWLSIVDRVTAHGRSLGGLAPSTYALNLHSYLYGMGYPLGAFLPLGVGRALVGVDAAWVFAPYLAFCGTLIGLALYSATRTVLTRAPARALVAFVGAQPALLYGYAQWGGIKELVAAALLALVAVLTGRALVSGEPGRRNALGLIVTAAALAVTLGPGAVAWLAPALGLVTGVWLWRARGNGRGFAALRPAAGPIVLLVVLLAPVWLELGDFVSGATPLFSNGLTTSAGAGHHGLASLYHPLSALQLAGVWPVGDFRDHAPAVTTAVLLLAVLAGLVMAALSAARSRERTLLAYPGVALTACLVVWLSGSIPWVVAKAMAIGAPAVPTMALVGAAGFWRRSPPLAGLIVAVIAVGVLWSNALAYHDVTLAPRARLAELQRLAPMLAGHGPTLVDEYDPYADRHFLRDGAPIEPAEYRPYQVPLANGVLLTQSAATDLDALSATTLLAYPSIVTRVSPVASRPPSVYALRWRGRYYELWQRPVHPPTRILLHAPFGDSSVHPFCGQSTTAYAPLCPAMPVAPAPCTLVRRLAGMARERGAQLVAAARPAPIVGRADQSRWPASWGLDPAARTLAPTTPGALQAHFRLTGDQRYALWLGGTFGRGFRVSVDGRPLGDVTDQLANIGEYAEVGNVGLGAGVHTITLRYPTAGLLDPGSGAKDTLLSAIVLDPLAPADALLRLSPSQATQLCGRSLDWIELVA